MLTMRSSQARDEAKSTWVLGLGLSQTSAGSSHHARGPEPTMYHANIAGPGDRQQRQDEL